jgi:hypothetical protein
MVFLLFNGQWREGAGGGDEARVDLCLNTDFFTDKTRPNYTSQPLHCNEKFIHAAGNHHWSRQNIRLVRTQREKISYLFPQLDFCSLFSVTIKIIGEKI